LDACPDAERQPGVRRQFDIQIAETLYSVKYSDQVRIMSGAEIERTDEPALFCTELTHLREIFRDAMTAFKQADEAMLNGIGVTDRLVYAALSEAWHAAQRASETAEAALYSHQQHCSECSAFWRRDSSEQRKA
jgi:hypothetical protein